MDRLGTVAIVGVGLIGGSVGLALRARGLTGRVIGVGRDAGRLEEARRHGAIDEGTTDPARGLSDAEVVVIGTPVTRVAEDVRTAARLSRPDVLITDAGSTKRWIVEEVKRDERTRRVFVGAHPIAGSERNGVAHARADLFRGRDCVLTPTPGTPADRLDRARAFWRALGCRLVEMDPEAHDRALALTSHLPHAVAAALAASIPAELLALGAGAYRDGTRVAGADPTLWAGIFLANRGPVLDALDTFAHHLDEFRRALAAGDEAALRGWWEVAKSRRLQYDAHSRPSRT